MSTYIPKYLPTSYVFRLGNVRKVEVSRSNVMYIPYVYTCSNVYTFICIVYDTYHFLILADLDINYV